MTNEEFYSAILDRVGFEDGAEVTSDGSMSNDLAHERAEAVLNFIKIARYATVPNVMIKTLKRKYGIDDE